MLDEQKLPIGQQQPSYQQTVQNRNLPTCWGCGRMGHVLVKCPEQGNLGKNSIRTNKYCSLCESNSHDISQSRDIEKYKEIIQKERGNMFYKKNMLVGFATPSTDAPRNMEE